MTNICTFTGNITEPELTTITKKDGSGTTSKLVFRIAVRDDFNKENVDWHSVEAWGRQAEVIQQYASKGSKLLVSGAMKSDSYEVDGQKRTKYFLKLKDFEFLNTKGQGESSSVSGGSDSEFKLAEDELPPF